MSVEIELPQNDEVRVSFLTDVKNNYFTRSKNKGKCEFSGLMEPTFRLFNGRLTFTFHADKYKKPVGTVFDTTVAISDAGHGPWKLSIKVKVAPPREKRENEPPKPNPKADEAHSRPDIIDVHNGPERQFQSVWSGSPAQNTCSSRSTLIHVCYWRQRSYDRQRKRVPLSSFSSTASR